MQWWRIGESRALWSCWSSDLEIASALTAGIVDRSSVMFAIHGLAHDGISMSRNKRNDEKKTAENVAGFKSFAGHEARHTK